MANEFNDMSDFENLANDLDEQGFFEAANEIDSLIQKTAKKKKQPGRNLVQWLRQLKKMQASSKVIDKFRKAYKGALEHAKKRKNYNPNRAEEYAMRTAVDGLPKKYLKEPTKFHGPEKKGPIQKADDASELATKLKLDVNKLKKLTPKQLQSVKKIRNPGLARGSGLNNMSDCNLLKRINNMRKFPLSKRAAEEETPIIPIEQQRNKQTLKNIRDENVRQLEESGMNKPPEFPEKSTFFGEQFLPGDYVATRQEPSKLLKVVERDGEPGGPLGGLVYIVIEEKHISPYDVIAGWKGMTQYILPRDKWDVPGEGKPPQTSKKPRLV